MEHVISFLWLWTFGGVDGKSKCVKNDLRVIALGQRFWSDLVMYVIVSLIGESLGLVLVSRLKFWRLSHLGLVLDENFSDSLVSFALILLSHVSVSS